MHAYRVSVMQSRLAMTAERFCNRSALCVPQLWEGADAVCGGGELAVGCEEPVVALGVACVAAV
eukprot:1186823-Prorocentrum_minimum.AAC.2